MQTNHNTRCDATVRDDVIKRLHRSFKLNGGTNNESPCNYFAIKILNARQKPLFSFKMNRLILRILKAQSLTEMFIEQIVKPAINRCTKPETAIKRRVTLRRETKSVARFALIRVLLRYNFELYMRQLVKSINSLENKGRRFGPDDVVGVIFDEPRRQ